MSDYKAPDWDGVRRLERRVSDGHLLTLTPRVITVLRRAAGEVAIDPAEVESALQSERRATTLLRKIAKRINRGSWLLMSALHRMYKLRDAGDLKGARQQMRKVLAADPVLHDRWIAHGQLDQLDDWKPPASAKMTGKRATRPAPGKSPPGKSPQGKTAQRKRSKRTARK